ncbi:hypothetical protein PFICI_00691 [Pestalotiopsis fici W106-1]|uniref:Enoyl reductase (ER) domain-containing protein n=1 Tax=Pestalotiopsis fici (strain W106-1 / CGMCC3.15140) TaxID=1229662 RepID=W3XLB8_PESFW|nr:uncharacterized protein PFICI_00691 [Pestalotiopsis fici W106-1]ETS86863.1 hypothetical protein PFICI_00691 [Pestalotiopsis fici W106-1]
MDQVRSWVLAAGSPGSLQCVNTRVTQQVLPNHILVAVQAASINPVDSQLLNWRLNAPSGVDTPWVVGRDFAGVVLKAAPGTEFMPGDHVMGVTRAMDGSGTLTDRVHINLGSSAVVTKPPNMPWAEAASVPSAWLTAFTAIEKCASTVDTSRKHKIAILGGSSPTGIYAIQIAHRRGWWVMATCYGQQYVDLLKKQGAHRVTDCSSSPDAGNDAVAHFEPDAILDCVCQKQCENMARTHVEVSGFASESSLLGGGSVAQDYPSMYFELNNAWLEEARRLCGRCIHVDSVFTFDKVKEAFNKMHTNQCRGRVVIKIEGDSRAMQDTLQLTAAGREIS